VDQRSRASSLSPPLASSRSSPPSAGFFWLLLFSSGSSSSGLTGGAAQAHGRKSDDAEWEGVRCAPSAGGGRHLLIRDHGVGRGVDELHGKMKVAPSCFCDLICSPFVLLVECLNLTI
jgi:hypothetical protein